MVCGWMIAAGILAGLLGESRSASAPPGGGEAASAVSGVRIAGAERPDIPEWFKRSRAFYCPCANSGAGASLMKYKTGRSVKNHRELPNFLDEARKLGTDVIYLVDYWEGGYEYKGTYQPCRKMGGDEAFRDGIAAVRRQKGRIILYLEAFIISRKTDFGRRVGPEWAMMDEKGQYYSYYGTGDRFYLMYPGEGSGWTEYLANLAGEMTRKHHIDGVHLDSYGLQWDWKDYHPRHPQGKDPASFNRGAVELVRRVRAKMREHNPQAVVILEGAEHTELLDVCDGAQIESLEVLKKKPWWRKRKYPIYTSSFELAEMKTILDEGYQLALSPWWFESTPDEEDEKRVTAKTDKRNRFDQLESFSRYNNLLVANGIEAVPPGAIERISQSIIDQLNRASWQGAFVNPELAAAAERALSLFQAHKAQLIRTPADQIKSWLEGGRLMPDLIAPNR
jgi:hypothetical protein